MSERRGTDEQHSSERERFRPEHEEVIGGDDHRGEHYADERAARCLVHGVPPVLERRCYLVFVNIMFST